MRRALGLLASAIALVCGTAESACAQDWLSQVFPERVFDFGTVARGSKIRHTFQIINNQDFDIRVEDVRTKCGCTDVRVGARDIPPKTKTVVEAVIDTTKFNGYKASGLTLILSKPYSMEVDLNLNCFIRGDVMFEPGQADFGTVAHGTNPSVNLRMTYAGGQPNWAVTKMITGTASISAKLVETTRNGGTAEYQMTVTLNSNAANGLFKDEVTLYTNDPSVPTIPVSVSANVLSAVQVSPSILNAGRIKAGQTVAKTIIIRSSQNQPFKIAEMKGSADLKATIPPGQAKPTHAVTVTFKAPAQPGPYHAVLEFPTDLKNEPPPKLSFFATVE